MRIRRIYKPIALALCCAIAVAAVPASLAANANSAEKSWFGTYSTGMLATDKDCPVVVESELLTFDINEFPQIFQSAAQGFSAYGAKVTARYTFYNPADYTVNMTLAFPFGNIPYYNWATEDGGFPDDTADYLITADGAEIERTIRHTYSFMDDFEARQDLDKLSDTFREDEYYYPDMPIYKYVFLMDGVVTESANNYAYASAEFDGSDRRVFTNRNGYSDLENGGVKIGWWVKDGEEVVIYSTDRSPENLEWKFYFNAGEKTPTDGEAILVSCEEITFKDLALLYREEDCSVGEIDWYNAVVDKISSSYLNLYRYVNLYRLRLEVETLMRWYIYSLTIKPEGRVVNEVTAPIYPAVDGHYEPWIYTYTYLLSPAQTWADFGSFEVRINTPFYSVKSSSVKFERTDYGYRYVSDGLPEGELTFSLCSSPSPEKQVNAWGVFFIIILILFIIPVLIPIITLIVLLATRNRRKSKLQ